MIQQIKNAIERGAPNVTTEERVYAPHAHDVPDGCDMCDNEAKFLTHILLYSGDDPTEHYVCSACLAVLRDQELTQA